MKGFLKLTEIIISVFYVIWNLVEILAIPALFVLIGALNSLPWQYYVATISGYFAIAIIIQIICHFISKRLGIKFARRIEKLFRNSSNKCSEGTETEVS